MERERTGEGDDLADDDERRRLSPAAASAGSPSGAATRPLLGQRPVAITAAGVSAATSVTDQPVGDRAQRSGPHEDDQRPRRARQRSRSRARSSWPETIVTCDATPR